MSEGGESPAPEGTESKQPAGQPPESPDTAPGDYPYSPDSFTGRDWMVGTKANEILDERRNPPDLTTEAGRIQQHTDAQHAVIGGDAAYVHETYGSADLAVQRGAADEIWPEGKVDRRKGFEDVITGLGNQRALHEEVGLMTKYEGKRIIVIDLDKFKQINDQISHAAGDVALKLVADAIRDVDPESPAWRPSGDEFLIMVDADKATEHAERVLQALRQRLESATPIPLSDEPDAPTVKPTDFQKIGLTFTYGVAETRQEADVIMNANKGDRTR